MAMPGRRPILSLYIDPRSSVTPTGDLVAFWSRFLVAFLQTAEELQHVVAVDMSNDPANALSVPAQGFVIAATSGDTGVRPTDIAFGQLLLAPGSGDDAKTTSTAASSRLVLDVHHNAHDVAQDVLAAFEAAGVREVLVVRRLGEHDYVNRIVGHMTAMAQTSVSIQSVVDEAAERGHDHQIPVRPEELGGWLAKHTSAGVLAFGQFPEVRQAIELSGRPLAPNSTDGVPLMVQSEVPALRTDTTKYLTLQGAEAGRLVAASVVRALSTGETVAVELPHAVIA